MSYKLNDILLSGYGIKAGRAPKSNIAVSGIFDLPKRMGKTHHNWDDDDTVEPYVEADEIFLAGRDIRFYGLIKGDKDDNISKVENLKNDISAFTDLVVFSHDDYGSFNVKIEKINVSHLRGLSEITINMREPQPDLSGGVLPATDLSAPYLADRMPLKSFGLVVSKTKGRSNQQEFKNEYYSIYGKEGYQINGRKHNEIKIDGFIRANDLAGFQANIKALWKLFTDEGLRKVRLNDYITIESFMTDGFRVDNIKKQSGLMLGEVSLKLIAVDNYITVYLTAVGGNKILTTTDGKIVLI